MAEHKGILFDKDGTLFSFAGTWSAWAARLFAGLGAGDAARAAELGRSVGYDLTGRSFARDSVVIAGTPDDIADVLLPRLGGVSRQALLARMDALACETALSEVVDLPALLGGLAGRGFRLGVATNDSERAARAHVARLGVAGQFDFIAGFDSGYGAKPGPGMLLAFAGQSGLAPGACVMVGDSPCDLLAGRAAGMTTVGVLTGIAGRQELAPLADTVLPDIGHLPGWLA